DPSPSVQLMQLKFLFVELDPTSPPATLPLPVRTVPVAIDERIVPELSPTNPPACRLATLPVPTLPLAVESEISPCLLPATPPSVVLPPCPLRPLVPAAPVTFPVANAFSMIPELKPTSPPPVAFEPTRTFPPADESAIAPKFCPTRPPAETLWHELLAAQSGPVWTTLAVAVTLRVAKERVMVEPGALNPASPPRLANIPLLKTLPVADDELIDPEPELRRPFWPTSPPSMLNAPPVTLPLADEPVMV